MNDFSRIGDVDVSWKRIATKTRANDFVTVLFTFLFIIICSYRLLFEIYAASIFSFLEENMSPPQQSAFRTTLL